MIQILFALILSLSSFASTREEASELLLKHEGSLEVTQRLDLFSKEFVGLPYGDGGPLGEGEQGRFDQDPLYRFDTFDCTTYIETIISLALSRDALAFEKKMDEIRYENGEIDYLKRNHFPSLQWIPNNVENGFLIETNTLILPASETKTAEAVINLPGWLKKIKLEEIRAPYASEAERQDLLAELRSYSSQYQPVVARLNYLPISTLLQRPHLLKKIPSGTIVNFVRPNWDLTEIAGTHMNVSHQGFIFQTREGTFLRHASSSAEKKVMNSPFFEYLKKFENHATMKGIHLMKVNQSL